MALELPCSSCKNRFPMEQLKCPPGSQSVVCKICMTQKGKSSSSLSRSSAGLNVKKPSLTASKEWPIVGMSKEQLAAQEKKQSSTVKVNASSMSQYKCTDCGFRFSKHADTKTVSRCPYCSRTRVQKVVNLIQDVDSIGNY